MKRTLGLAASLFGLLLVAGCASLPPGAEPGPHGTMAYYVEITATEPGARIEANGQDVGTTPLKLKIFGDTDGTFHDFGSEWYVIRALPVATNQYPQARYFGTGRWFGPEDRIPPSIQFDMNRPMPAPPAGGAPYPYPYPYPYYYYPPPYYYGPTFYFGAPYYYHGHYYGHHY